MAVENLFEDSPIYCFSNHPEIAYVIIPFSEAVVERGFSKMNFIMTKKRCSLSSINLDALM